MDYLDEEVPQAGVDEPMEQEMGEATEPSTQPGVVFESPPAPSEVQQEPVEQELPQELAQEPQDDIMLPTPPAPAPRIRKVRVSTAPAPAPARPPPHVYWPGRLQEHRDAQRAEKTERYSNLRLY
jgi:hypothetical protein